MTRSAESGAGDGDAPEPAQRLAALTTADAGATRRSVAEAARLGLGTATIAD